MWWGLRWSRGHREWGSMRGVSRGDLVASGLLDIALLTVSGPWPLGRHCPGVSDLCLLSASWAQDLPTRPTLRSSRMLGTRSVLSLTVASCDLLEHSQHGGLYSCHHLWLISDLRFLLGVSVGTLPRWWYHIVHPVKSCVPFNCLHQGGLLAARSYSPLTVLTSPFFLFLHSGYLFPSCPGCGSLERRTHYPRLWQGEPIA